MGEVLENGVYLPDEGERNAYNGLKGNWNTVDTVVAQVQALSSTGLIRKPVDELPTEDIETNVIYMLKATKPNGDVYRIEYMYIDNHWDALGTSETTLDDYYTKAETDNLPAVKSGINATRVSNYDAHLANNDIHVTLANKQSWDGKQNALDTNQTAAVNSGVTAAKVTGYDTHVSDTNIHVTTSDKTAWNAKQDGLSQTQLAAVNSGITEAKRTGYDSHVADTDVHVTTADKTAWNGKQNALTQTQLDNIAAVPDKADSADLATVATTGDYGDLLNAPTIPTVNNASLTIQKNGADVATFTANASSNVTANLSIPTKTSELDNDAGFLTQHNPIDNALSATSENALQNKVVKSELDGKASLVHTHAAGDVTSGTFNIARIPNLDASKITSGTIDIARLPKGSLERLVKVANQAARYALTTDDVQLGDTVQQLDTGVMYVVTDETKLDSADGYTEFTAGAASSVPWTGVTGKPNDYPPSSHTHTKSQITDFPTLATVATSGSYNDLNNIPATFTPSSHTHGNLTNDGKIGTTANVPLITGTGGVVQAGSFGNSANTFCEGNDSRLSDARTPVAHTHGKADITDLFNSANVWAGDNTFNKPIQIQKTTGDTEIEIKNKNIDVTNNTASAVDDIRFFDKNGKITGGVRLAYDGTKVSQRVYARSYSSDGTSNTNVALELKSDQQNNIKEATISSDLLPATNNAYDLGSSSYQWNNLYAKNYYYNGTAWGLNKKNVWTNYNVVNGYRLTIRQTSQEIGVIPASNQWNGFNFVDKNETNTVSFQHAFLSSGETRFCVSMVDNVASHDSNSTVWIEFLRLTAYSGGSGFIIGADARPMTNNAYELGSSTNKWKTLNGINPGALSFPEGTTSNANTTFNPDLTNWLTDGTGFIITAQVTGWLHIRIQNSTGNFAWVKRATAGNNQTWGIVGNSDTYSDIVDIPLNVPVVQGYTYTLKIKSSRVSAAIFMCLGNV